MRVRTNIAGAHDSAQKPDGRGHGIFARGGELAVRETAYELKIPPKHKAQACVWGTCHDTIASINEVLTSHS
jgi:hypothetical protein